MALVAGTAAVIAVVVALVLCLVALVICFILFCCLKIGDDSNIRKRIITSQTNGAYVQDEIKTSLIQSEMPQPVYVPAPLPVARRQIYQEQQVIQAPPTPVPLPPPPPPPQQPEVIIHEVVHRYEPPPPQQQIVLPAPQPLQQTRLVRRSSWAAPQVQSQGDEWIMIKKTRKQKSPKVRVVRQDSSSSSSSSDEEEVITRQRRGGGGAMGRGVQYMMPSLSPYDLAIPQAYQRRPTGAVMMSSGTGMGAASYMVGARPQQGAAGGVSYGGVTSAMMATPAVSTMPMMAGVVSSYQTQAPLFPPASRK